MVGSNETLLGKRSTILKCINLKHRMRDQSKQKEQPEYVVTSKLPFVYCVNDEGKLMPNHIEFQPVPPLVNPDSLFFK